MSGSRAKKSGLFSMSGMQQIGWDKAISVTKQVVVISSDWVGGV